MRFFDTNALLCCDLSKEEFFIISSITLEEIENIKTNRNKIEGLRFKARKLAHWLDENEDKYEVCIYGKPEADLLDSCDLEHTPDNKIIACASVMNRNHSEELIFVTGDICCKNIARNIFHLSVLSLSEDTFKDEYKGFVEKELSEEEMSIFYNNLQENIFDLIENQYLVIKDLNGNIVDKFRWHDNEYQVIKFPSIKSNYFGSVKPYNGDIYQQMVLNSLAYNQLTMIKGAAGTGKSYLALGYLLFLLEKRKIDKIVVFCNTVATANSAKLGYYPGSKDEKLLDSQIGNMLAAKLGDSYGLEQMIAQNKIQLLPLSDIRGFDTNGMNAGIYITEAQNMDISLMKLALQRIGEDCICIIDGDYNAQVDLDSYAGENNGMRRMSEVFRGQYFYGEIELQNIYRSKIAEVAENM